jgi:hypothetical protein
MYRVSLTALSTQVRMTCVDDVTFAVRPLGAVGIVSTVITCEMEAVPRAFVAVKVTAKTPAVLKI